MLEVQDDSLVLNIFFLMEYKSRMIVIEERQPIVVPPADFEFEDWRDGVRKNCRHRRIAQTGRRPNLLHFRRNDDAAFFSFVCFPTSCILADDSRSHTVG